MSSGDGRALRSGGGGTARSGGGSASHVSRRVRLDLALAAAGWLLPWGAWLAGDGGVFGVVVLVAAAFFGTPLLAAILALLACGLQWGVVGTAAFVSGVAGLVTGRPLPPDLLPRVGQLLAWLALGWRAAAAASRPSTRSGVETELRQAALGWVALAIAAAWAPLRLLGPALLGLGAFLAGALDGLALSQLHEFERRFGTAAERRGYRSASGTALWVVAAGATLVAWILAGGGGILAEALHLVDQALTVVLTPVFIVIGYVAQVVLALIAWLLHGRKLKLPSINQPVGAGLKNPHAPPPGTAPVWAVLAGRWLLVLAVVGAAVLVLALLRARRVEDVEEAGFSEEREALPPLAAVPPRRRGRGLSGSGADLAIRRIFRRWLELAADRGRGRRPEETAREHLRRALTSEPALAEVAAPMLRSYERGRYGVGAQAVDPAAVAEAERALDRIRREWRPG